MRNFLSLVICALVGTGFFGFTSLNAATLPDAATPGGALPHSLENRSAIADDSDKLVIPKVIDRPLEVDAGERVKVREFILKGVDSHETYNIRKEDVAFIAEANRVKRQRLDEADMEGFTPEEVDDIAEFIRQLVEEPNQRPTSANLWKLVFKLRKSEWNRGLTMGQIQEVADEITRYYRQKGMILATAFIPAQDVVDGKVTIEVLEGKLGKVIPESNEMYKNSLIQRPFNSLLGKPVVKKHVETGLLFLGDSPGLSVSGIFRPGGVHGETDLLLKVIEENRVSGGVSIDNNGSKFTGEYRARFDLQVNNPTTFGDKARVTILQTASPENTTFGNVLYEVPVLRNDWLIGGVVAHNEFTAVTASNEVDITGESTVAGGYIKKIIQRNRGFNVHALAELLRKKAMANVEELEFLDDHEYDVGKLEIGFDGIDRRFVGINVGSIQLYQGLGSKLGANGFSTNQFETKRLKGGFQKVNVNFSRLQTIKRNVSLLLTSQLQFTDTRLNSLEQMAFGGADSVRAYPISEYLMDRGVFGSLELIVNAPGFANKPAFSGRQWGEVLSLSLFYDLAKGDNVGDQGCEVCDITLQGAGAGIKISLPGTFAVRFQAATVVGDEDPLNNEDKTRFYGDMAYYF